MKRCYYEILEVDRKATPAEIKTSYRKMALKYHPDKNSEQDAKHRFVQINEAYNVLSDANERTWYDNNREKILFNKDELSKEDLEQYSFGFNIWSYFTMNCFEGYGEDEKGFYAIYRDVFERIKSEETKAFNAREDLEEEQRKLQGFGNFSTPEEKVLKFYNDWQNFTTYKTFVWIEEYDTRDANNRWVKREMQKQNKKQRQGQKKTFLKTIKDLVAYVKKRDPRFRDYMIKVKEEQERRQQQKIEREREKKKEKQSMKVVKQQLEEERFKQIEEYYKKQAESNHHHHSHQAQDAGNYAQDEQFYCDLCEKGFKSENQLRNHEKSKQHKQMVKDIEKQVMLKEEIMFKAKEEEEQPTEEVKQSEQSPKKKKKKKKKNTQQPEEKQEEDEKPKEAKQQNHPKQSKQTKKAEQTVKQKQEPVKVEAKQDSQSDDDDRFMNTLLNNRNKKVQKKQTKDEPKTAADLNKEKKKQETKAKLQQQSDASEQEDSEHKMGKAKLKKLKKAEQEKSGKAKQNKCNVCNEVFASKTKLFEHINKSGHASAK